jgi:hypothetical protein
MRRALLLAALLAPVSCALAQETQKSVRLPEELAITRSVVMQENDELESSVKFDQFKFSQPFYVKKSSVAAEFEYGLTDRWELDAEVPYRFRNFNHVRSVDGIGDVETAVRYGVVPVGQEPFAVTAGLGVGIPTGDRAQDLGDGRLTLGPFFTASTWFGPVNVQCNGGWARAVTSAGDEPRDEFEYNIAALYPVGRWFLVLEGNGVSTTDQSVYYVTPELIWKPMKNVKFMVAVPVGVTRESADYGIVAAITLELDSITHRGADKD